MVTRISVILTIFFALPSSVLSQVNRPSEVLTTETERFQIMMKADTQALRAYLAEDLVYIHSNSLKESQTEHLQTIGSGKIVYQNMVREGSFVRFYGKTAVNTGELKVKGLNSGNPFDIRMFYTAIYRKHKGRWLLHHWQSTRIP